MNKSVGSTEAVDYSAAAHVKIQGKGVPHDIKINALYTSHRLATLHCSSNNFQITGYKHTKKNGQFSDSRMVQIVVCVSFIVPDIRKW